MRKIFELAALRSKRVELAGETFVCLEPPFSASADFSAMLKENRTKAYVFLLTNFVKLEDGKTQAFTEEEAATLANGRGAAFLPLFLAITGFVTEDKAEAEKKASTPTPDSATG